MSVALIVNPTAGAGRGARLLPRLELALSGAGRPARVIRTGPEGAAAAVREAVECGVEGIVVLGGDGTLSQVAGSLLAHGASCWVMPVHAGTGGDFRRSLRLPTADLGASVRGAFEREPRRVDLGRLRARAFDGALHQGAFLNIASFGVGGLVDQWVNTGPKWMGGRAAFFVATLRALAQYVPDVVSVRVDGRDVFEGPITNVAIANGRFFGGGMQIAPRAQLDDGHFDVVVVRAGSIASSLGLAPKIYRGTHLGDASIVHARGARIEARLVRGRGLLDVDGETPGTLDADFEVIPGALLLREPG